MHEGVGQLVGENLIQTADSVAHRNADPPVEEGLGPRVDLGHLAKHGFGGEDDRDLLGNGDIQLTTDPIVGPFKAVQDRPADFRLPSPVPDGEVAGLILPVPGLSPSLSGQLGQQPLSFGVTRLFHQEGFDLGDGVIDIVPFQVELGQSEPERLALRRSALAYRQATS